MWSAPAAAQVSFDGKLVADVSLRLPFCASPWDTADPEAKLNELRRLRYAAALDMPELAAVPTNELHPVWAAAA